MPNCPDCGYAARGPSGLKMHQRRSHPETLSDVRGANAAAIDATLALLKDSGRIEDVDAARVQALRSMAEALDLNPFNSQMWREYREAIEGLCRDDRDSGKIDELLDQLSS